MIDIKEISLLDVLPENLKQDEEMFNAASAVDDNLKEVSADVEKAVIMPNIEKLSGLILDLLAWQFHVDLYNENWVDEIKRNLVMHFAAWHQLKGTKAGLVGLLNALGYHDTEIYEYHEVKQAYINAGVLFADGTWDVTNNSPKIIKRSIDVVGLPDIPHWANFAVKLNLAEMTYSQALSDIRWAIDEMRPARAWPLWFYVIKADLDMRLLMQCIMQALRMSMHVEKYYPWCKLMVDGSWTVGPDPKPYTIDKNGNLIVDGSWNIGELIFFAPVQTIYPCMAQVFLTVIPHIASIGHPMTLDQGDRTPLRADGSWNVGYANTINAVYADKIKTLIDAPSPAIKWYETHRTQLEWQYAKTPWTLANNLVSGQLVNGSWNVGDSPLGLKADGTWDAGLDPLKAFSNILCEINGSAPVGGVLIGYDDISIDGSWNVGDSGPKAYANIRYI